MASEAQILAYLENVWTGAGGSSATAPVAASVAWAESSGNPNAVCYDYVGSDGNTHCSPTPVSAAQGGTGQEDIGLWQIANLHAPPGVSPSTFFDPTTNAQEAISLSGNGQNFASAWPGTYGSQPQQQALAMLQGMGGNMPTPTPGATPTPAPSSGSNPFSLFWQYLQNPVSVSLSPLTSSAQFKYWYIVPIALGMLWIAYALITSHDDDDDDNQGGTVVINKSAASEAPETAEAAAL